MGGAVRHLGPAGAARHGRLDRFRRARRAGHPPDLPRRDRRTAGGTNDYDVLPDDITRAADRVFGLLADEHDRFDPPLRSVCFPLLGSGRGGLPYATSASALWAAVEAELARGADWEVHLLVRGTEAFGDLLDRLPGIRPDGDPSPPGASG